MSFLKNEPISCVCKDLLTPCWLKPHLRKVCFLDWVKIVPVIIHNGDDFHSVQKSTLFSNVVSINVEKVNLYRHVPHPEDCRMFCELVQTLTFTFFFMLFLCTFIFIFIFDASSSLSLSLTLLLSLQISLSSSLTLSWLYLYDSRPMVVAVATKRLPAHWLKSGSAFHRLQEQSFFLVGLT